MSNKWPQEGWKAVCSAHSLKLNTLAYAHAHTRITLIFIAPRLTVFPLHLPNTAYSSTQRSHWTLCKSFTIKILNGICFQYNSTCQERSYWTGARLQTGKNQGHIAMIKWIAMWKWTILTWFTNVKIFNFLNVVLHPDSLQRTHTRASLKFIVITKGITSISFILMT